MTKSVLFVNHSIREPVSSQFFAKPKFLELEPIIYGCILATDPKNISHVPFIITDIPILLRNGNECIDLEMYY